MEAATETASGCESRRGRKRVRQKNTGKERRESSTKTGELLILPTWGKASRPKKLRISHVVAPTDAVRR